jgi:hypothetical protein
MATSAVNFHRSSDPHDLQVMSSPFRNRRSSSVKFVVRASIKIKGQSASRIRAVRLDIMIGGAGAVSADRVLSSQPSSKT